MILKIIGLIFILTILFSFFIFYLNTHPPRCQYTANPSQYRLRFENIEFKSTDGKQLKGWFLHAEGPPPSSTIIIAHGLGASKSDFVDLGAHLIRDGFNVLLFDFRAHGESQGSACSLGLNEQDDLRAAVEYVKARPDTSSQNIGVYGFSLGASICILAAANDQRIGAVVADSPFSGLREMAAHVLRRSYALPSFPFIHILNCYYRVCFSKWMEHVTPLNKISGISPRPVLLITGDQDSMIPPDHTKNLYQAARTPKELWVIKGASHGSTMAVAQDRYYQKVSLFFKEALQNN
jgi:alpha-beta hydrolase superfamily lysophospholipase